MKVLPLVTMTVALAVTGHLPASAASDPDAPEHHAPSQGATLDELMNPQSTATTGVNNLRAQLLSDGGRTVGFRGGMLDRARELAAQLQSRADSLDKMFQFASLIGKSGALPPVIVQAQDVAAFGAEQIRTVNQVYKIEKEERLVSTPPTWRDYLLAGLPLKGAVELPMFEARAQDSKEALVWRGAVATGWREGRAQADAILEANFHRLTRDYTGMILYASLLQQGLISSTKVSELAQTVTGDGKQIMIGDTLRRLTGKALFDKDYRNWRPSVLNGERKKADSAKSVSGAGAATSLPKP